jgi:hypothetical protein
MAGKSPLKASAKQKLGLEALAASRDRGEADRARAVLLTLAGWTSRRIAEAFAVREDSVRLWRSDFMRGGFEALKASIAPGPVPVKTETGRDCVATTEAFVTKARYRCRIIYLLQSDPIVPPSEVCPRWMRTAAEPGRFFSYRIATGE